MGVYGAQRINCTKLAHQDGATSLGSIYLADRKKHYHLEQRSWILDVKVVDSGLQVKCSRYLNVSLVQQ